MSALVHYRSHNRIGYIELARPGKLNALNDEAVIDLQTAIEAFDVDDQVDVGILSGQGSSFCSGADVAERQLRTPEELARLGGPEGRRARVGDVLLDSVSWKPILAAVHGHVIGAGLRLMLHCDLAIADETTRFRLPEVARGLDAGPHWSLLTVLAGGSFATEVAITSREWSASEALAHGIVARVVTAGEHIHEAEKLAHAIAEAPRPSVRALVESRRGSLREIELRAWLTRARGLHLTPEFRRAAEAFINRKGDRRDVSGDRDTVH